MTTMKNSEIEVLRGIAIVMAVAAHFNGFLFPGGVPFTLWLDQYVFFGVGVDLFFCISGFVVSKSLIPIVDLGPDFSTKWLAIKAFWTRRVYRLLPAAWFWALFGLVCSMFFSAERFSTPLANLKSIIAIATFFGNIGQYLTGALGPNVAYWSLALEEQFYFLFPFFLLLVAGPTRWVALAGLIALQFMISRDSNIWWWIRFDGLTWGVLLYLFSTTKWHEKCRLKIFSVGWVRISLLLLALYIISALPKLGVSVAYGLVALVCAALVFLASYHAGYIPGGRSALFAWLGSRSYSIYLAHIPAYRLTSEFWGVYNARHTPVSGEWFTFVALVTAFSLIAVLSEISFRLIETPLRRRRMDRSDVPDPSVRPGSSGPVRP